MSKKSSSSASEVVSSDTDLINIIVEEEIQLRRFGNIREVQAGAGKEEILSAWNQDRASLDFINSSLKHTELTTNKMLETLRTFDSRVETLLVSINQVQTQTEVWKRLHSNINKGLTSIQDILAKFDRVESVKSSISQEIVVPTFAQYEPHPIVVSSDEIIPDDQVASSSTSPQPTNQETGPLALNSASTQTSEQAQNSLVSQLLASGIVDLDTYLHNLDSVLDLEKYFQEHRSFSSAGQALSKLSELHGQGMSRIFQHFTRLLNTQAVPLKIRYETFFESDDPSLNKDGSKPPISATTEGKLVQHVSLLRRDDDLLKNTSLDSLVFDQHGIVQLVAEAAIRDLHKIIQRLMAARPDTASKGSAAALGYLDAYSLNRSLFLMQSIESAFSMEAITKCDEESTVQIRKQSAVAQGLSYLNPLAYIGYAEKELQRERQYLNATSASYIRGSHLFLLFLKCLLVILRSEKALVDTIIPAKSAAFVFAKSCEEVLSLFTDVSEQLLKQQKRTPNKVYGISVLLDTYSVLKGLLPLYDQVLKKPKDTPNDQNQEVNDAPITSFWAKLTSGCRQTFQQFQADVKNDASKSLPTDGNVHELTSSTINFLRHLFFYKDSVLDLLPPLPATTNISPLGDYIVAVINGLKENLEYKAKRAEKKTMAQVSASLVYTSATSSSALANVFLINNYYFIWKTVSNSSLASEIGDKFIQQYSSWVDEQKDIYKASWVRTMSYLSEETYKDNKYLKAVGTKANALIKSRFKSFNSDMAALFTQQVQFFIPDEDLRRSMRTTLVKMIVPAYQAFLAKYSDVEFTKSREKYVKFDVETLETMLGKFFEGQLKSSSKLTMLIESLQQQNDLSEAYSQ